MRGAAGCDKLAQSAGEQFPWLDATPSMLSGPFELPSKTRKASLAGFQGTDLS